MNGEISQEVQDARAELGKANRAKLDKAVADAMARPAQVAAMPECERSEFEALVRQHTDAIAAMLIAKNKAYGNSALDPVRCFSRANPVEQIKVRIDDKISRLMRGGMIGEHVEKTGAEDAVLDLIGYLILLRIAQTIG